MKKKKNFWQKVKALIIRPKKEVKIELDKKSLKAIGQAIGQELVKALAKLKTELAKKLTREIVTELKKELAEGLPKIREAKRVIEPRKIKIKESFINPIEETVKLKSRFSKKPKRKKISGISLGRSLKALKKIGKPRTTA